MFILTRIQEFFEYGFMVKIFIRFCAIIIVLSGCSYSFYSNAYPHLKKIRVMAFENQSSEFELADKALEMLSMQFRNDGRLRVVTQAADCQLEGVVINYKEDIYSFDSANNIQDYQIRLSFSITFTDLTRNETIYENKNLLLSETYAVSPESTSKNSSKEEAIDEIFRALFRTIIQNSLETW